MTNDPERSLASPYKKRMSRVVFPRGRIFMTSTSELVVLLLATRRPKRTNEHEKMILSEGQYSGAMLDFRCGSNRDDNNEEEGIKNIARDK
ncbi:hypothetical protein TNCT_330221 [Trichonephila clavata]|uniref:Uncharacterized protein n=1 Tax=Trichonephila clavata TaxID=2740835 RepID=A0A8X6JBT8_TRICU|nr:hypothetical protein TNCT_317051 [Trichonephila clavata]GFR29280.1 hypothetical protein TNCT_330221 [Trichonephila clavata]